MTLAEYLVLPQCPILMAEVGSESHWLPSTTQCEVYVRIYRFLSVKGVKLGRAVATLVTDGRDGAIGTDQWTVMLGSFDALFFRELGL